MRLVFKDNKIIVFLNKKINLDKVNLENYFKRIFFKIRDKYNLKMNGYYDINVYTDKYYGSIIEMENEDLDYYNYFNQIDMKIKVNEDIFIYKIDYDYLNQELLKKTKIYKSNDKLYLKIIDSSILNKILEFSEIVYGDNAKKIIKTSEKVIL